MAFIVPEAKRAVQVGQVFGRLTVLGVPFRLKGGSQNVVCECECGLVRISRCGCLKAGIVKSCGCLKRDDSAMRIGVMRRTHGKSQTKLYETWKNMRSRCENERSTGYCRYGARGIRLCREWSESFEAFESWALRNGYEHGLEIDRIDASGDYEPSNCRFVDEEHQANNRRTNRNVFAFGEIKTITQWSRDVRCCVRAPCLSHRIKSGWSPEVAMTTPAIRQRKVS